MATIGPSSDKSVLGAIGNARTVLNVPGAIGLNYCSAREIRGGMESSIVTAILRF